MAKRSADAAFRDVKRVQVPEPDSSTTKWSRWLEYMRCSQAPLFFFEALPKEVVDMIGGLCGSVGLGTDRLKLEIARCMCQSPLIAVRARGWSDLSELCKEETALALHAIVSTNLLELLRRDSEECAINCQLGWILLCCFSQGVDYIPQFVAAGLHLNFLRVGTSCDPPSVCAFGVANLILHGNCIESIARFYTIEKLAQIRNFTRMWMFVALRLIVVAQLEAKSLPDALRRLICAKLNAQQLFAIPAMEGIYRDSIVIDAWRCDLFQYLSWNCLTDIVDEFSKRSLEMLSHRQSFTALAALCENSHAAGRFSNNPVFMRQLVENTHEWHATLLRIIIRNARCIHDSMRDWVCESAISLVRAGHAKFVLTHLRSHPRGISAINVRDICAAVAEVDATCACDFRLLIASYHMGQLMRLPLQTMLADGQHRGYMPRDSMQLLARVVQDAGLPVNDAEDLDSPRVQSW